MRAPSAHRPQRRRPPEGGAFDLMACLAVIGVVGALLVAQSVPATSVGGGALLLLTRATGPVVVALLTIFLWRAYDLRRGWIAVRLWLASVAAAALVYVVWSAIYLAADGSWLRPLPALLTSFARDLLTAGARANLSLVLVTVQLCVLLPVVRWLVHATRGHHRGLFTWSLLLQLGLTVALQWWLLTPYVPQPVISIAGALLPSHLLFVVAGALLVDHSADVVAWLLTHRSGAAALVLGGVAAAEASYAIDVRWWHSSPRAASALLEPAVMVAALAGLLTLYGAGMWWESRRRPEWQRRLAAGGSRAAAGIYLVHPLLLQAAISVWSTTGLGERLPALSTKATIGAHLVVGVPLLYAASWVLMTGVQHSVLSAALTGRRRRHAPHTGQGDAGTRRFALSGGIGTALLAGVLAVAVGAQLFPGVLAASGGAATPPAAATAPSLLPETTTAMTPVAAGTSVTMHAITVGGRQRTFEVVEPAPAVAAKLPVLVFLHGIDSDLATEEYRDGLLPLASAGQAIIVYPAGFDESWNVGTCCSVAQSEGVDDVSFLSDVVHEVAALPGAAPDRISVLGYSDGGKMVYNLVCHEPRLVTAAVVVAALPASGCAPGSPVPLLQVIGTLDPVNPYQNVVTQVTAWRARDGCSGSARTQTLNALTTQRWTDCTEGSRVELATYAGAGHGPFGGNGSPSFEQVAWSFLQRSPLTA